MSKHPLPFMKHPSYNFREGSVIKDGKKHHFIKEKIVTDNTYQYHTKKLSKNWLVRQVQIVILKYKM